MFKPMFIPPRHNPLLCRLTHAFLPSLAPSWANIQDVRMESADLERRLAGSIGAQLDPEMTTAEQLHDLANDLRAWVGELPDEPHSYDVRRYRRRMEIAAPLFAELLRFQNFIAVSGDYIAQNPTAERFLEILGRLEKELFGEIRNRVSREALVRVGTVIRLEERLTEYRENKRGTVRAVTAELEGQIRTMLQELSAAGTPLSLDF